MKILDKLAVIASVIIVGATILFWFWVLYPYNPLEIEQPVKVLKDRYKPGETIFVEFNFKKNTFITPEIHLAIIDGVVFNIPEYSPVNKVGETNNKIVGVLDIPLTIPCGTYHLEWSASYNMNPIRTIQVFYESEEFYVESEICNDN